MLPPPSTPKPRPPKAPHGPPGSRIRSSAAVLAVRKKLLEARSKEGVGRTVSGADKGSLKSFSAVVKAAHCEEKDAQEEDGHRIFLEESKSSVESSVSKGAASDERKSPRLPPRPSSAVIEAHEEMFQKERRKARMEIAKKRQEQKLVGKQCGAETPELSPRDEHAFCSSEEEGGSLDEEHYHSEEAQSDSHSARSGLSDRGRGHLDNIYEERSLSSIGSPRSGFKHDSISDSGGDYTLLQRFADWQENTVPRALCSDDSIAEMHELVTCPVPKGELIKCQIERIGNGESKDYYSLTIPITQKDTPRERRLAVMLAQKKKTITRLGSAKYVLSLEHEDMYRPRAKRSAWYFGKLKTIPMRSTLFTSSKLQYVLTYDADIQNSITENNTASMRPKEVASIVYTREVSMTRTRSHMTVALAPPTANFREGDKEMGESLDLSEDHLGNVYGFEGFYFDGAKPEGSESKVRYMEKIENDSKRPSFSHLVRFPIAPSIKNYELRELEISKGGGIGIRTETAEDVFAGMARVGTRRYYIIVKHPMSVFQAFGVALSRLDATSSVSAKLFKTFKKK